MYGSFPTGNVSTINGGEVGNMRTVSFLEKLGFDVIVVKKVRTAPTTSRILTIVSYPFRTIRGLASFRKSLISAPPDAIVHISGFYGPTIFNEVLIHKISVKNGHRVVYEMRGGGADHFYETGSRRYRRYFEYLLRHSDSVLTQGLENLTLLQKLAPDCRWFYYPNCLEDKFLPLKLLEKPTDKIVCMYSGRLEKDKNVKLAVRAVSILQKKHEGVRMIIVGGGSHEFVENLKEEIEHTLAPGSYDMVGPCPHEEAMKYYGQSHFLLFPSVQMREGQSNTVTEAMAFGVVPVASPQGFSRSLIDDDSLIAREMTAECYASIVDNILESHSFEEQSRRVSERIRSCFSEERVLALLKSCYDYLLDKS